MKQSPQDRAQRERLESSRFSADGFMGTDRRPVDRIVADDGAVLRRHGISAATIAHRLRAIDDMARAAQGAPVPVADDVTAIHYEAMGRIPSPFPGDGVFPKGETRITWHDGRCLRVTKLGIALIERRGFFQGRGSPYRIEPELAAALPAVSPGHAGEHAPDSDTR